MRAYFQSLFQPGLSGLPAGRKRAPRRTRKQTPRCQLILEVLEERTVPAVTGIHMHQALPTLACSAQTTGMTNTGNTGNTGCQSKCSSSGSNTGTGGTTTTGGTNQMCSTSGSDQDDCCQQQSS